MEEWASLNSITSRRWFESNSQMFFVIFSFFSCYFFLFFLWCFSFFWSARVSERTTLSVFGMYCSYSRLSLNGGAVLSDGQSLLERVECRRGATSALSSHGVSSLGSSHFLSPPTHPPPFSRFINKYKNTNAERYPRNDGEDGTTGAQYTGPGSSFLRSTLEISRLDRLGFVFQIPYIIDCVGLIIVDIA